MATVLDRLAHVLPKSLLFGLVAASGGLIGALLGEGLLLATRLPPIAHAVVLLIDNSWSMQGLPLAEVQSAALQFMRRHDRVRDRIAVVSFGSWATVATGLTGSLPQLEQAIQQMGAFGTTRMDLGLQVAEAQLRHTPGPRHILLFTDGLPDSQPATLQAAQAARALGIRIVAVATDEADMTFLARVTGDSSRVFRAVTGQFEAAFQRAEAAIYSMVESSAPSGQYSLRYTLLRIGAWTALLAVGIGLALIRGQNAYLHRPLLTYHEGLRGVGGSLIAGCGAGALGELCFAGAASVPALQWGGRIVAWAILGALLGWGMATFVPNLHPRRALVGGGCGGVVGALGFLGVSEVFGDVTGRLMGAMILGCGIGLMVAWVEAAFREAWLEVRYGPREARRVSLGREPVSLGGGRECTVYAPNAPPVALRYFLDEGRILCEDLVQGRTLEVVPGDCRAVGTLTVTVGVPRPAAVAAPAVGPTAPPAAAGAGGSGRLMLRLSSGQVVALVEGLRLRRQDIPGLEAAAGDGLVAEVVPNPHNPTVLGLRNLSQRAWEARVPGVQRQVEGGQSIWLAAGMKINFGGVTGDIQ
jgi:Ca-activated chloride channel family protein